MDVKSLRAFVQLYYYSQNDVHPRLWKSSRMESRPQSNVARVYTTALPQLSLLSNTIIQLDTLLVRGITSLVTMLLLGLTGSIATGKSTVSQILSSPPHNLPIIDADVLARQVVEPGTAGYRAIVSYFGPKTPDLLLPPEDPLCGGKEHGVNGKGRPLNRPA